MSSKFAILSAAIILVTFMAFPAASAAGQSSLRELVIAKNDISLDGDVTGDYVVDDCDLIEVEDSYGTQSAETQASDINGDGEVNIYDLRVVGMNYGNSLLKSTDAAASSGASIYVSPSSVSVAPGDTFQVSVNVNTQDMIFGGSIRLGFDKNLIVGTAADEGPFLGSDGVDTFSIISIDNDTGVISYDITRFGTDVGVSGNAAMLIVTFRAVSNGVSQISVSGYELIDEDLYTVPVTSVANGTVTVQSNRAPVISAYTPASSTPSVNEGSSLAFSVTASDPDSDPISYSWKLDGVQVSTSSSYTYSPDFNAAGTHTVIANVSDPGKLFASRTWTVTVNNVAITCNQNSDCGTNGYISSPFCSGSNVVRTYRTYTCNNPGLPSATCTHVDADQIQQTCSYKCISGACVTNQAPSITAYSPIGSTVSINEGEPQGFSVTASDPYGDPLTYSWRLNGAQVSTTPSYAYTSNYNSAGTYTVLVNVSDGVFFSTKSWQLTVINVNRAPTISSYSPTSSAPSVNEGSSLAFSVTASDPDSDALSYQWKLDGVQVSTASGYTYSPDFNAAGTHTVIANVSDTGKLFASRTWTVTVNNVAITCNQNSDCGTNGYIGSPFCSGLDVMRTYRTYTCNNPGTPSASCSSSDDSVKIETCAFQCSAGACVTNHNPVIATIGNRQATEGALLSFPVTATDADGHTATLTVTSGPGSMSGSTYSYIPPLDSNHVGEVSTVTIKADDGHGGTDYESFTLTVTDVNRDPVINAFSPTSLTPSVNEGQSLAFSVTAADADGDALSYSWKLDGATVSTASGYTYSPGSTAAGTHTVVATVSDGYGGTATKTWTVTVNDVGTVQFQQQLFYGVNTVQLPSRPVDTSITSVLSSVSGLYNSVLVWDSASGTWLDYKPGRPDIFNTLRELDGTKPFSIEMKQNAMLTVEVAAY